MPPRLTHKQLRDYTARGVKQGLLRRAPKIPEQKKEPSVLEERLIVQLDRAGISGFTREHRFCERRWRFDVCWVGMKLAVEVEGGLHCRGRHVRPDGFRKDAAKYRRAAILGW